MQEQLPYRDEFPVSPPWLQELLPAAMARCRFRDWVIDGATQTATASRDLTQPGGVLVRRETLQIVVHWQGGAESTVVQWAVFDYAQGQQGMYHDPAARQFQHALRMTVYGAPEPQRPPHNPLLAPAQEFNGQYTGNLRDYSFCATEEDVQDLYNGVLPLGVHAFGESGQAVWYGRPLYLSTYRTGKPMLYNGVLVCAPQNSGKTSLIVRWARAANAAGYNIFLVDVKGNLYTKLLSAGWHGRLYYFSTSPEPVNDEPLSDRLNFLSGYIQAPLGITAATTDRIKQLVTALLPSEGWSGGIEEFHYRNRVVWLTALVHLLLLRQIYYPWKFKDCQSLSESCQKERTAEAMECCPYPACERTVDLSDLYELAVDERLLYQVISELQSAETRARQEPGVQLPVCGVAYWVRELALLLDRNEIPAGQRPVNESYQQYTVAIKQALEPFGRHGTLYAKIRDNGPGRLFRLEDLGAQAPAEPVTIVLAAREQDQINAETILSMTIARLQQLLFDRMPQDTPRPILLLLDETRRIRGFAANQYITFAREAKAGCVIVYQSLDQIGEERKIYEILENVGTQIYLGSLVGNTAQYFIHTLPKWHRAMHTENVQQATSGVTRTQVFGKELVEVLTTNELYKLPAGDYPALVYVADQPRRQPFLVDMNEALLPQAAPPPQGEIVLTAERLGQHASGIRSVAFWPDSTMVTAAGDDEIVQVYNVADGALQWQLLPQAGGGRCVAVSRDGSMIAAGSSDGRVVLCQTADGRMLHVLEAHTGAVTAVAFAPDGQWIASASADATVLIHAVASGHLRELLTSHAAEVTALAVAPSGTTLVSAARDGTARVWSTDAWTILAMAEPGTIVEAVAYAPDERFIALACSPGVQLWDVPAQQLWPLTPEVVQPTCIAFAPSGLLMAVGGADGTIYVWRTEDWQLLGTLQWHHAAVTSLMFAPDGGSLASGSLDHEVYILQLAPLLSRERERDPNARGESSL
ncbi:MAG: TraM recognition domain-containing protein [Candidatus Tectimicrobiota bacterium]